VKAIQLRHPAGLEQLQLVEIAEPGAPGPGEIRVRIHANSLNYHDLAVALGALLTDDRRIPMADGAGVVEAVGTGVTEFSVGDAVVSTFFPQWLDGDPPVADFSSTPGDGTDGYACEVVVRPATWFTHAPRGYSHAEAATLTTAGVTAWRALIANGGLKAGESVLVMGSGGVSTFALQIAKAMGAIVVATSSSDSKLERLRALGGDHLINYRREPEWAKSVLDFTSGRGVDHVVEVGGAGTLAQSINACRVGGHIALVGVLAGPAAATPTNMLMRRQQRLQGLLVGSRRHHMDLVRALNATGIRPVVDRSFGLADIAEAFKLQKAGGQFGKIVLEF
jgi:NADPH:quinone reductase-like Zn-dependent oxidoreductase